MGAIQSRFLRWRRVANDAARDGNLELLKDVEACDDIEAAYLSACEFQPVNSFRTTQFLNAECNEAWKRVIGPFWIEMVAFASTPSFREFTARISTSGKYPSSIMGQSIENVSASLGIILADAAIVMSCLKLKTSQQLPPRSDIFGISQMDEEQTPHGAFDYIRFIKPHTPSTDYMSTIIATNGAKSVLASEHDVHYAIMIPTGFILAQMMSTVFSKITERADKSSITIADDINIGSCIFALCLLGASMFISITALIVGSPNRLDDYTACRYLAIRWQLRFLDVILFFVTIMSLIPIASLAATWSPFEGSIPPHPYFFMFCIGYLLCITTTMFLFFTGGFRMISSYAIGEKKRRLGNWLSSTGVTGRYMQAMGQFRKSEMSDSWKASVRDALASNYTSLTTTTSPERDIARTDEGGDQTSSRQAILQLATTSPTLSGSVSSRRRPIEMPSPFHRQTSSIHEVLSSSIQSPPQNRGVVGSILSPLLNTPLRRGIMAFSSPQPS